MSAGLPAGPGQRWQELRKLSEQVPLRIKLITAVLALVAIALITISVAGISFLRSYLIRQQDAALRTVNTVAYSSNLPWPAYQVQSCLTAPPCPQPFHEDTAVDWLPSGGRLQAVLRPARDFAPSQYLPGPALGPALPWLTAHPGQPATVGSESGDHRWRVVAYRAQVFNGTNVINGDVITAIDVTSIYDTLGRLARIDLVVSVIVIVALAIIGVAIVRSSLRPLTDIERTAQQIASGDLTRRVPEWDPRSEVGRLGHALNMMLAQIEAAFGDRARSEAAARRSEERMRQFAADASHELRTPVTVIRGYAEYYRQRGGLGSGPAPGAGAPLPGDGAAPGSRTEHLTSADMDRIMERVEQESARMGGLVEDMLLLARLDEQRPLERRPVDLLSLVTDAVADARVIAPARRIELAVQPGAAFLVLADAHRLRQVISNLMSNALTHTPDGTPVDVRLRTGSPPGRPLVPSVILEVADSGPGLTKEQADRVFERFYRTDQARRRRTGGTGLGLAIVAALVAAHGGTVSLDTAPGQGATFRITLPLAPEAHEVRAAPER